MGILVVYPYLRGGWGAKEGPGIAENGAKCGLVPFWGIVWLVMPIEGTAREGFCGTVGKFPDIRDVWGI